MKKLVIAVDLQNDFCNPDGSLYVKGSEEIKPVVEKLIEFVSVSPNYNLWYTMDTHELTDPEISSNPDFVSTFPPHCVRATDGAQLIDCAYPAPCFDCNTPVFVFEKDVFSVFEGNKEILATLNAVDHIENIYVFGVVWEYCVKAVVEGLLEYKDKQFSFDNLYIISDAIASLNPEAFEIYLNELTSEYNFIKVVKSSFILGE